MRTARNTIILPARFLFYFLIFLLGLTAVDFLMALSISPEQPGIIPLLIDRLPYTLKSALVASCLAGFLAIFFTMLKKPGSRLMSFILLLLTASAVLIFGRLGLQGILPPASREQAPVVVPGKFHAHRNGSFYVDEVLDGKFNRIVIFSKDEDSEDEEKYKSKYIPSSSVQREKSRIILRAGDGEEMTLEVANDAKIRIQPEKSLKPLLSEYELLNGELDSLMESSFPEFILLCAALVFVLLSTQVLMRISRWPLFNFLLVLSVIRGISFLYSSLRTGSINVLETLVSEGLFSRILPSLLFLALGVLLSLIDILFVPYDFWTKEVDHEETP